MKLIFNKNLKIIFIIVNIVVILAISVSLYYEYKVPKFKEEKIAAFSYKNKANVNYSLVLKPNILYGQQTMEEGKVYISEFTDSIKATFKYEFSGDKTADIKGDYEIVAAVEGYNVEEKNVKIIWSKAFIPIPKTGFESRDKAFSVTKDVQLKLEEYSSFVKKMVETSKVSAPARLSVTMNVNLNANTDKGPVQEKISSSIIVPLSSSFFEVVKNEPKEKAGAIEEVRKTQLSPDKRLINLYYAAIGTLVLALAYLIFFTTGTAKVDPFIKNLNKIFKNHGSRLVALNSEIKANYKNLCTVRSIEDLVRVADEVSKPIMYQCKFKSNNISKFYVFDETWMYVFDLKEATAAEKGKEPEEIKIPELTEDNKIKKDWTAVKAAVPPAEQSKDL